MADEKWGMAIDNDKCIGCQACVVACQSENNIPINSESLFNERRAIEWIRIERYWEGEFPDVKARFIPILCQHQSIDFLRPSLTGRRDCCYRAGWLKRR